MVLKEIKFNEAYPKLHDKLFTTIRAVDKCDIGELVTIVVKGNNVGRQAHCVGIANIKLKDIPIGILYKDVSSTPRNFLSGKKGDSEKAVFERCLAILRKFYPTLEPDSYVKLHFFHKTDEIIKLGD